MRGARIIEEITGESYTGRSKVTRFAFAFVSIMYKRQREARRMKRRIDHFFEDLFIVLLYNINRENFTISIVANIYIYIYIYINIYIYIILNILTNLCTKFAD